MVLKDLNSTSVSAFKHAETKFSKISKIISFLVAYANYMPL